MLETYLGSSLITDTPLAFTAASFFICTIASLALGILIAAGYMYRTHYSQSFVITLALLPAIVQLVIMMVNGNLGTGIAVMGAFSLVRFRSIAGTAKEICSIFLAMAAGLACGMGYLLIALLFVCIVGAANILYTLGGLGKPPETAKLLKITIPESLDYTGIFDDLFRRYTKKSELLQIRTTNMGSLYKLDYYITLKDSHEEKAFLDELRCRNGNLEISCAQASYGQESL